MWLLRTKENRLGRLEAPRGLTRTLPEVVLSCPLLTLGRWRSPGSRLEPHSKTRPEAVHPKSVDLSTCGRKHCLLMICSLPDFGAHIWYAVESPDCFDSTIVMRSSTFLRRKSGPDWGQELASTGELDREDSSYALRAAHHPGGVSTRDRC